MTTKELLRDKLAPAIGRVFLKYAFGVDASTIGGPVLDWISAQFKNRDDARQAERFAREISNRLVDGLAPVFERDHSRGLNPEAVALALGETLDQHFDGRFLVAHDLDPQRLIEATFELRPIKDLRAKRYSTADIELYERALPPLIEALVPQAKKFSDFEVANATEVLKRLRRLADTQEATYTEAREAHATGRRLEAWFEGLAHASDESARTFEIGYLRHIEAHLDDVQLVGITADPAARRQRLSKAYIPLSLSSETTSKGVGGPVYFESLLDVLTPARNRLLVVGAAGSGKTTLLRWAAIRAGSALRHLNEFYADGLASSFKLEVMLKLRRGEQEWLAEPKEVSGPPVGWFSLMRQLDERGAAGSTPSLLKLGDEWLKVRDWADEAVAGLGASRIENAWWLRVPFLIPLRLGTAGSFPDFANIPSWRPITRCRHQTVGSRASCKPAAACS